MQIFFKHLSNEEGVKEWVIVELQGDLGSREEASLDEQFVGDLYYNREGSPILIIGHHILFGTVLKLEKPFAVLEKVRVENERKTEYSVKAVIKRKLCFRDRPKPIVGSFGTESHTES